MANPEHLAILKRGGVREWNEWQAQDRSERPDLLAADLSGADLSGANLRGAKFKDTICPDRKETDTGCSITPARQ